jgi:hypothetical protein
LEDQAVRNLRYSSSVLDDLQFQVLTKHLTWLSNESPATQGTQMCSEKLDIIQISQKRSYCCCFLLAMIARKLSHPNFGEEHFLRDLPVFASLTLHHEIIRVVRHLALAVPTEKPQIRPPYDNQARNQTMDAEAGA